MNTSFSASRYAETAATAVWSLGWIAVACAALPRFDPSGNDTGVLNLAVALVLAVFGLRAAVRSVRHEPAAEHGGEPTRERLARRVEGWVAAVVWCGVGFGWNVGVFRALIQAADEGRTSTLLIMVPFSLIGWFLLVVIFTGLGIGIDSLLRLGQSSTSATIARPSAQPAVSQPMQTTDRSSENILNTSPVLGALLLISSLNWFVFFGTSIYLGGDALGTLPSRNGYVVTSHGHQTAVSERVWQFSLFYSGATLLVTPAIWLTFAVRQFASQLQQTRRWKALLICGFVLVWVIGWYSSIGSSMSRSINDWKEYKRLNKVAGPNRHPPDRWRRIQAGVEGMVFQERSLLGIGPQRALPHAVGLYSWGVSTSAAPPAPAMRMVSLCLAPPAQSAWLRTKSVAAPSDTGSLHDSTS